MFRFEQPTLKTQALIQSLTRFLIAFSVGFAYGHRLNPHVKIQLQIVLSTQLQKAILHGPLGAARLPYCDQHIALLYSCLK